MNYKKLILASLFSALFVFSAAAPVQAVDLRVVKLKKYFTKLNSPLADKAEVFVAEADKNKLDYRLLPAISGVESTFAKNYIEGTFNAYGWGGGEIRFESWEAGIKKISQSLTQKPYNGVDPDQLAPTYCPPNSVKWAFNVQFFMDQIEKTEAADLPVKELRITI